MDATSEKTAVEREIASVDPRPGGEYRCQVISGNLATGEFVEVDEPRRLVFTWGWESGPSPVAPGSTTIAIELLPDGDGTLLRFAHRDLPGAEATEKHAQGWDHYLPRLATVARGDDPGRDTWLDR